MTVADCISRWPGKIASAPAGLSHPVAYDMLGAVKFPKRLLTEMLLWRRTALPYLGESCFLFALRFVGTGCAETELLEGSFLAMIDDETGVCKPTLPSFQRRMSDGVLAWPLSMGVLEC